MEKYTDEEMDTAAKEYLSDRFNLSFEEIYEEIKKYNGPAKKVLLYENWFMDIWFKMTGYPVDFNEKTFKGVEKLEYYNEMKLVAEQDDGQCRFLLKAVIALINYDYKTFTENIDKDIDIGKVTIPVIFDYAKYFHNGYQGFWRHIIERIKDKEVDDDALTLACGFEAYYDKKNEDALSCFLKLQEKYNNDKYLKSIIGEIYYELGMWNNCIAYLEELESNELYLLQDMKFNLAWASDKVKNLNSACKYYKECIALSPEYGMANNNLGYVLFRLKRYDKAYIYLKKCIDENLDFPYAKNNYVRVLLKLGKIKEAKDYAKRINNKLNKDILEKLNTVESQYTDLNLCIDNQKKINNNEFGEISDSGSQEEEGIGQKIRGQVNENKKYQFSSEKILEDELTASIEKGVNIFGFPLKVYKRKGEYGRQYIIPIGRLDLLCEDEKENLYIIELKKDSGYDDPYMQTKAYIDWFEKNKVKKGQKVYGIICLNNPTPKTVSDITSDPQVRLFEYNIQYNEIKKS